MLNALAHAISLMHSVKLPLCSANAHDTLRLIFTKPYLLSLTQNSFTNVVEEMSHYNERECDRIHPVDTQMEDPEANDHPLSKISTESRGFGGWSMLLPTQKLPVNNEMLKKAALASRYKMGTIV